MAEYYVDPVNGSDARAGTTQGTSWRTATKAAQIVVAGDTVWLMDGNHNVTMDVSRSGTASQPISWKALSGHTPVLRGSSTNDHILYITNFSYNIFQGITFTWNGASPNAQKRFHWIRVSGTNARHNYFWQCTWKRDGDIADIYAAGWADWGFTIASAQNTWLYQCIGYGMKQAVQIVGTRTGAAGSGIGTADLYTLVEECTLGPTTQSCIKLGTSYGNMRRCWIKNCILQDSYNEDGIQWLQDTEQPDGNITNIGAYVSGTVIRRCGENGLDFKGAGRNVVDGCIVYGIVGSGNGPTGGYNRNSLFSVGIGAGQDADQTIIRNSIFYDNPNIRLDWDHYYLYNNTYVGCNRDYSGNPSALGTPSGQFFFGGVRHIGGGAPGAIKNCISVGHDDGPYGLRLDQGNIDIDYNLISGIPYTYSGGTWTQAASFAAWQTTLENAVRHTGNDANTSTVASVAAVLFNNVPSRPTGLHTAFDFGLQAGSPAKAAGGPLTTTSGAGTNSTTVPVQDAGYFFDGFGISGVTGDTIVIGAQVRTITAVDYANNELTISEPATFSANTDVYFGDTTTPDIGAPAFGVSSGGGSGGGGGGGGTPAGTGAVVVAAFAAQVAGGDQPIPLPTGLSTSPLALKFVMSRATANDTPADTASVTVGFALPTSPSTTNFCINIASEHGQNPSDTFRKTYDDACVITIGSTAGLDGAAVLKTVASDEVVITWTNAPGAPYLGYVIAYECEAAYLNSFAIQQTQNTATNVDVGFAPDLAFFASALRGIPNTRVNVALTYGVLALVGSGYVTYAIGFEDDDNDSPTIVGARVASNYVLLDITTASGSIQRGVTVSVADTTLTMTTTDDDWSDPDGEAVLFALKFDNLRVHAGVLSTPTTVSEYTYPDSGFLPSHVEIIGTLLEGINTGAGDGKAGSIAIGAVDGNGGYSVAYTSEDASTTSDTQSVADAIAMNLALDTGADGVEADIIEFTSVGPKFDFTVVTGAAKTWLVVSVETPSNGLAATDEGYSEDYGVLSLTWQMAATDEGYAEDYAALTLDLDILSPAATDEGYAEDYAALSLIVSPITTLRKRTRTQTDSRGLTLSVYEPLSQGDRFLFDITGHISDYSHEIAALGGFWSASIKVTDRQGRLEDWYERGLDRRIVAYNPEGQTVFEGFVNALTLNLAGLTKTVGPVLNISNQVRLVFSYVDSSGDTSIVGLRLSTDWAEDLVSQERWGIIQRILSSGGATPEDADSLRDDYLRENAQPETDEQQSFGGNQSEPTMDLALLGYVHRLQNYVYNSTTTGAQDLSAKIAAVVAAEPNGYLSSATGFIAANTFQVAAYDNDNKVAWNIIKELVAKGDANNDRAIFGVYEDRTVHYQPVVEQIDYYQALSDPAQRIATESGLVVAPWDVRPGRWLFSTDFLVGRVPNTTALRSDPRAEFIEGVTYRAPWALTLRGSKIRRIDQKLAKLGLAGIGG